MSADNQPTRVLKADSLASESKLFLEVPWIARLLSQPGIALRVPGCRQVKETTEDSLMSEMLNNSRGIQTSICFYNEPPLTSDHVTEVTTLFAIGDGLNGHPGLLHGGIIATLIDESMGIYKSVNQERSQASAALASQPSEKLPPNNAPTFTAELKVTYLRPVRTPSHLMITAYQVKKEGRKEWIRVEFKQMQDSEQNGRGDSELITCATGQALFIEARPNKL